MSEQAAEPEQPDMGQDGPASSDSPYGEYLSRVPDDAREAVEPIFKEWDANVTRRFQDAADQRKQWEPYEQLGVNQVDPGYLEQLIQFGQLAQNPEQYRQWLTDQASQAGLLQQQQQEGLDDGGFVDPQYQQLSDQISQLTQGQQQLMNAQQQWAEYTSHQEHEQTVAQNLAQIEQEVGELETKYPHVPRELAETMVSKYVESDPEHAVAKAFEDASQLVASIEKQALTAKLNQPSGGVTGGGMDSSPEPILDFKQAGQVALEQLRAARQP